jgi:hypothetical protein
MVVDYENFVASLPEIPTGNWKISGIAASGTEEQAV